MEYKEINPPVAFVDPFKALQKEAQELFNWFIKNKDERVKILEKAVTTTLRFENWKADCSLNSISELSDWFSQTIKGRKITPEEIEEEKSKLLPQSKDLEIHSTVLSSRDVSICFDVGLYLGECLKSNSDKLKWELFSDQKNIDHNQPVLNDFGGAGFNPRMIGEVQGSKILKGKKIDLLQIYDYWVKFTRY